MLWQVVYLFVDKVNGASRVDVHKVNICVVVDELCTSGHGVREAALNLETQFGLQNQILQIMFITQHHKRIDITESFYSSEK